MDKAALFSALAKLPIYQYALIDTGELVFSERVRHVCRTECPMYGKSWACPPAVGTVEQCREKCLGYPKALLLTTVDETDAGSGMDAALAACPLHEEVTRKAAALVRQQAGDAMVLSARACTLCEKCTYPAGPCRHPDRMLPCVEGYGILVTALAEQTGMEFFAENMVTWFSLIFYRE